MHDTNEDPPKGTWEFAYPTHVVKHDREILMSAKGQALMEQAISLGFLRGPLQFGHLDCWAIRKARATL